MHLYLGGHLQPRDHMGSKAKTGFGPSRRLGVQKFADVTHEVVLCAGGFGCFYPGPRTNGDPSEVINVTSLLFKALRFFYYP